MASLEQRSNIDSIVGYIIIKKLTTPIVRTAAYKKGIVNNAGRQVRDPQTDIERQSFTLLDKIVFKLKRLLGGKISNFNNFLYLQTMSNDFYNKLIVRGTIKQRSEIDRIQKDIKHIKEKYDASTEELVTYLINEDIKETL